MSTLSSANIGDRRPGPGCPPPSYRRCARPRRPSPSGGTRISWHRPRPSTRVPPVRGLRLDSRQNDSTPELLADFRSRALTVSVRRNEEATFLGQVGTVDCNLFRYPYALGTRRSPSKSARSHLRNRTRVLDTGTCRLPLRASQRRSAWVPRRLRRKDQARGLAAIGIVSLMKLPSSSNVRWRATSAPALRQ
jgi:hypothetical protein